LNILSFDKRDEKKVNEVTNYTGSSLGLPIHFNTHNEWFKQNYTDFTLGIIAQETYKTI